MLVERVFANKIIAGSTLSNFFLYISLNPSLISIDCAMFVQFSSVVVTLVAMAALCRANSLDTVMDVSSIQTVCHNENRHARCKMLTCCSHLTP